MVLLPPVAHDPGGVVTGPDWHQVIADRWTGTRSQAFRNVDAET